jgi:transposase-like protein
MTFYQPATPETDAIVRPACPRCGARMMLARIEPDSPGHERRTFECPSCEREEATVVAFR